MSVKTYNNSDFHQVHSITNKYDKKFESVDNKKTGFIKKISRFINTKIKDSSFVWMTHVAAEHMSQGTLAGNNSRVACSQTIGLLEKMQPSSNNFQKVVEALKYAEKILNKVGGLIPPYETVAKRVKKDIGSLKEGEFKAISSKGGGHATMMLIKCTKDNPKTFELVQHNTGYGVNHYHYCRDLPGKKEYQTTLEITDISYENLCGKNSTFFRDLLKNGDPFIGGDTDFLYNHIIPQLKGKIAPASDNNQLWSDGQIGGSCTARCNLSLIRSVVEPGEYKQFMDTARFEMLLRVYTQLKKGEYIPHVQKVVALEAIAKLEHSYEKRKLAFSENIKEMKSILEEQVKSHKSSKSSKPLSKSVDSKEAAFEVLRKNNFNPEAISLVEKYLLGVAEITHPSQDEVQKMVELLMLMKSYCYDRLFTEKQIYIVSALSATMIDHVALLRDPKDKTKNHPAYAFALEMLANFSGLKLHTKKDACDEYIGKKVDKYFAPRKEPQMSEKMIELNKKMSE